MAIKYTTQTLFEILHQIKQNLKTNDTLSLEVLNPASSTHTLGGEIINIDGEFFIYRGFKAWVSLAEIVGCKITDIKAKSNNTIEITLQKLQITNSFHTMPTTQHKEKYGANSCFARISKNEEPTFLHHYIQALKSVAIVKRKSILNLGVNRADEFEVIQSMLSDEDFYQINLVGIDHSHSALKIAKERFNNGTFLQADINDIKRLNIGRFSLIISIGTLQSPSINYKPFLMQLVQNHLEPNGAIILGFPNSRWIDTEIVYGAKAPNYSYSELSLLFNDVIFAKKYLQQKKFRVTITGREYIFLVATKIGSH